jgi:hypothetical protein
MAWASPIAAQSAQRFSVQAVGVYVIRRAAGSNDVTENRRYAGGEVQLRYSFTLSRLSVGLGYQESSIRAGFVEPRVVVAANGRAGLYLSGRAGLAELVCAAGAPCAPQKPEQLLGAGGGILLQLNRWLAVDLGALYQFTYYAPVGQVGLRSRTGWGQLRVGLSAGL